MADVRIENSWKELLLDEFSKEYWESLTNKIKDMYKNTTIYPPPKDIFKCFDLCPFKKVKVVIIGQDPYHGPNQAHGLCFSVSEGVAIPPSLKNIFKEIENDTGIKPYDSGDLTRWATQGVLLLNSVLTVSMSKPGSHQNLGWETFTSQVVNLLNTNKKNIVYMLWGNYAKDKGAMIDRSQNLVLESAHPSPFSAQLFFNQHHFTQCNSYLQSHNQTPIDWR